jgi:PII-like signaling protein
MQMPREAVLLRIFIGERDTYDGRPLFEAIVRKAREMQLAGATVLRGSMGYGYSSRLHTDKILQLSFDLPLIIEIVDGEKRIGAFLAVLDTMIKGGLVTIEPAQIVQYGAKEDGTQEHGTAE